MGANWGIDMAWVSIPMIDVPMPMARSALISGRMAQRIDRRNAKNKMISAKTTPAPSLEP